MNWQDILKLTPVSKTPIARLVGAAIADAGTVTPDEDATLNKAPPIRNPREAEFSDTSNDDLSDPEIERLFEKVIDPEIEKVAKRKGNTVYIRIVDLKMSKEFATKKIVEMYGDEGYGRIRPLDTLIEIRLNR